MTTYLTKPINSMDAHTDCSHKLVDDVQTLEKSETGVLSRVIAIQNFLQDQYTRHERRLKQIVCVLLLVLYFAYFGYALYWKFGDEGSLRLTAGTVFATCLLTWRSLRGTSCRSALSARVDHIFRLLESKRRIARW